MRSQTIFWNKVEDLIRQAVCILSVDFYYGDRIKRLLNKVYANIARVFKKKTEVSLDLK